MIIEIIGKMLDFVFSPACYAAGLFICVVSFFLRELSRPKDLYIAGIFIFLGLYHMTDDHLFTLRDFMLELSIIFLVIMLLLEISTIRWNMLSDIEKNRLYKLSAWIKNFEQIPNLLSKFRDVLNKLLNFSSMSKKKPVKKWFRSEFDDINKQKITNNP